MKLNMKYVIFGSVLLLVLLISMASACGAMPYSATTRSYATFEGLETKTEFDASVNKLLDDLEKLGENDESIKQKIKEIRSIDDSGYDKKELKASLKGLTDVESSDMYKQIKKFIQEKLSDQEEMKVKEEEVNVKEGFENRSQSIDIFGTAVGNQNCVKTASGLSNSMGALCLSDEQLYMLQSRGGNSTGRDSQIGA
jgi:predicted Holliday junction resolvase-like endonuclease